LIDFLAALFLTQETIALSDIFAADLWEQAAKSLR